MIHRTLRERMRDKTDRNGPIHRELGTACHLWTAATNRYGYGIINVKGRVERAHRVAYALHIEPDPIPKDLGVCHACDVRNCVNPDHLYLAPHAVRMREKSERGRAACKPETRLKLGKNPARGDNSPARLHPESYRGRSQKLMPVDVLAIRASTEPGPVLAARYGVSAVMISQVRRGESWSHLGGDRYAPGRIPPPPPPIKDRLSVDETRAAILALLPPEDIGGTRRHPDKPYRYGALRRLAARLGVSSSMVNQTWRDGATVDLMARWRAALTP